MKDIVEEAKEKAVEALKICSTKNGLYASGGKNGYTSVWARDSMISLIGASVYTGEFKNVFRASLDTLAKHQSKNGQIPNDVDVFENRKLVSFATVDSSLWFVLGEHIYRKMSGQARGKKYRQNTDAAMKWLSYQDAGEDMMPEQLPTSDWMDCFPHKYGHTINTQALYYAALRISKEKKEINAFRKQVDKYLWSGKLGYYLPWHWKDHGKYFEKEEWFDSLGNMLAIVFGLAGKKQAESILDFVEKKKIAEPYPMKVMWPPIRKGKKEWQDYFSDCLAKDAYSYINSGIWPFVGGFYVCALVEAKRYDLAEKKMESLARANRLGKRFEWDFNEWIHPISGKAEGGRYQAWSAGGYLLAYEAVKRRKNPLKL